MPIPRGINSRHRNHGSNGCKQTSIRRTRSADLGFIEQCHCCCSQFGFRYWLLKSEFARQNLVWPETKAEVDTLRLASLKIKDLRSKRLEKVAGYLSIPLENAHRAVHDAQAVDWYS